MVNMLTAKEKESMTILIVDDEPTNLQLLGGILSREGYEIDFARDGEGAIELSKKRDYDLILLDIMMPGIDGYEVCRRLKLETVTQNVPVIFVTAMGKAVDEQKGLLLGAVDYIKKPFSIPIVRTRVETHLVLKRQRDILNKLSSLDGLTGIANRRFLDENLSRHWRHSIREHKAISFIMIDIDFFKLYNDTYGHLEGDNCLKSLAATFTGSLKRPGDFVARYGGEEFAVVLPETDESGLCYILDKLWKATQGLKIPHEKSNVSEFVTISQGGVSTLPSQDSSLEAFISRSDQLLYNSKEKGRNRYEYEVITL